MSTSPTLALTLMTASQAQKEVLFNELLLAFDSLFRGVVISSAIATPPGSPSEGDCYILASSPTGAWSGQAGNITFYFNGWQFVTAKNQMRLYDEASSCWRVYHSSSSTWDAEPAVVVSVLDDLSNVEGTPTDGQVLTYRTSDNHWKPQTPATPSLTGLSDVTVTEGSGLDGKVLYWKNADTKWEAKALATVATSGAYGDLSGAPTIPGNSSFNLAGLGDVVVTSLTDGQVIAWHAASSKYTNQTVSGGGGGSSTLAGDTDVSLTSPTDGQVLTYNGTAAKWENANASGGGGGASPPSLTTFSEQALASGVTVTTNYVAGKGLTIMRTDGTGSDVASFQGEAVPTTTPWTVTAQVRQINMGVGYLRTGLGLYDTSSTKALSLNFNNQSGTPNYGMFSLNSGMSGYASNYGGNNIEQYTPIPEWFRLGFDGTTYTGYVSWDGGTWFTVGTVTASTLGWTATHVGLLIETYGGGGSGKGGLVCLNYSSP